MCVLITEKKKMTATYTPADVDICQRVCPPPEVNYYEPAGTYFAQIYTNSMDAHSSDSKFSGT